jgi:hypothetical protein
MTIDILYFKGCPNAEPAFAAVREVVREMGITAEIRELEVRTDEEAARLRFLGSPTVQVDGVDIEPNARNRTDFSFSCRMFGPLGGAIPKDLLRVALLGAGNAP